MNDTNTTVSQEPVLPAGFIESALSTKPGNFSISLGRKRVGRYKTRGEYDPCTLGCGLQRCAILLRARKARDYPPWQSRSAAEMSTGHSSCPASPLPQTVLYRPTRFLLQYYALPTVIEKLQNLWITLWIS